MEMFTHTTNMPIFGLQAVSIIVANFIGYIGVCVMAYGAIKNIWLFVMASVNGKNQLPHIRLDLGKHLALGLEFLVAKDVIESIISPTWNELGKLGAIIALRTFVTIFLGRELHDVEAELEVERKEFDLEKEKALFRKKK